MTAVDDHLRGFPSAQRRVLAAIRSSVQRLLPGAEEVIAWGMPSYRIDGDLVLSFTGFREHNSLFPGAGVIRTLQEELRAYDTTKGTIHLPRDAAPPTALLRSIIRTRICEINASYPKSSGVDKEFYDNGRLKRRGRVRNGLMQGPWVFYRRDGSPLRSGSFRNGDPVGEWTTHPRA